MLRLHRSARLTALADVLADVLRVPPSDPLAPEWVVVGSRPLERWLAARLAERLGVCAHVRFLSPSTLVEEVVEAALGTSRETVRAWSVEPLTWRVLAALPALLPRDAFAPVRRYLQAAGRDAGGAIDVVDARAFGFARRVAECFARYATADWEPVRGWDLGEDVDGRDAWQPALWRVLARPDAAALPAHPAALVARAADALRAGSLPAGVPARVSWVALPGTAPLYARLLATLASVGVEVHALQPLPPRAGQGATSLRRSLGRSGDRLDEVLDAACHAAAVDATVAPPDAEAPEPATALGVLRALLLRDDGYAPGAPVALDADDASWRVHACHGPVRQAEVLRDELLALLDADPTLRPRDVLVLTPDPALAAPLVEAAFAATGGAAALPLRVLDRPQRRTNPVADVALRVLELAAGRVDAVGVLDLVTQPAVAERFGLDAGTEDVLRRWVRESGVRWGLDAHDRADVHGLPADEEHTWRFGLERLLLGWGLPGDGETLWGGALPLDMAEGGEAERLGRFAEACARVFDGVRAVRGCHAPAAWRDVLLGVTDALVHDEGPALLLARRAWRESLDALADEGAACARPLDASAVRLALSTRLDEPSGSEGAAGAVTLARLSAGRVVPARVIALLGLDDGAWPRGRGGVGFDLLARARAVGAPDPGGDDRQRLLEAVLAAGERLIVTYTGRTLDTNEEKAPAVPVGELLDALDAAAVRADGARGEDGTPLPARSVVERAHPLQPFGEAAFGGDGRPAHSHDAVHLGGARALRGPRRAPPRFLVQPLDAATPDVVTVDELATFLAAPERTFVAERLRVRLGVPEALDVDDPLELDALDGWALRRDVLARLLDGGDAAPSATVQRAAGRLPHGPLGDLAFREAVAEARTVQYLAAERARAARTDGVTVDRVVGRWRLVGRVGPLFDGGLFDVHAGKVRARHLLSAWVRHLALHLADAPGAGQPTSRVVGMPGRSQNDAVHVLRPVPDAGARLAELLALYERGMREPLPLLPESAREYARAFTGKRSDVDAHRAGLGAAEKAWSDRPDLHALRLLGDDPFADPSTFTQLARQVWAPLLACTAGRTGEAGA